MSYGRPPPDVDGMTSLKVDNLTYRTTPETLRHVFEKYGRVGDVYIPRDRYSKDSRGFAFVRFLDKRDAEDAMDAMDGALLDGRELRVQMARYGRPPDSHYSGGRRGSGGGGGGPPRRYGGSGRRSRR
ncbi:serine/arginine-rich splicing factor 2-like [Hippocampus comes]|uniref:serine/arginine-rich splicing factor 2-like n=1 Tax=Hippocampus comes TaxID=109280 RepID=UPI00094E0FF2|nr:PREDICTED: serine/arginine-rich splicing factor 2-like [Hippocampus comes]